MFQGIPEQIGVVTLAYALAGIPFRWKELIPIGIFLAIMAYLVRALSFPFGSHTIVIIFILFLLLTVINKGDVSRALIASLLSILALMVFEFISISVLSALFGVSKETWFSNTSLLILFGEPQVILLFVTAFLIRRKKGKHAGPFPNEQ